MKVGAETPPKIPRPRIGGTELILEGLPWNRARPPEVTHPVGEPGVDVDRQWGALQSFDGSEVDEAWRRADLDAVGQPVPEPAFGSLLLIGCVAIAVRRSIGREGQAVG